MKVRIQIGEGDLEHDVDDIRFFVSVWDMVGNLSYGSIKAIRIIRSCPLYSTMSLGESKELVDFVRDNLDFLQKVSAKNYSGNNFVESTKPSLEKEI